MESLNSDYIIEDFTGYFDLINQIPVNFYEVGDQILIIFELVQLDTLNNFIQDNCLKINSITKLPKDRFLILFETTEKIMRGREK